jgi:hypothetical protein
VTRMREALRRFGAEFREVYSEELYLGKRPVRLARLNGLLGFLDFAPTVVEEHRSVIEEKIFQRWAENGRRPAIHSEPQRSDRGGCRISGYNKQTKGIVRTILDQPLSGLMT